MVTLPIKQTMHIDDDGQVRSSSAQRYTIWDDSKGYLSRPRTRYVRTCPDNNLSEIITNTHDYAYLHRLAEHLYKDTGMIAVYINKQYRPASIRDIASIIGASERTARDFLTRMVAAGLIARAAVKTEQTQHSQYHINPLYFSASKFIPPSLYMIFREQLDPYLPRWVIQRYHDAAMSAGLAQDGNITAGEEPEA